MLTNEDLAKKINELIAYASDKLSLKEEDEFYVLNTMLDYFNLQSPGKPISIYGDFQNEIIDPIVNHFVDIGKISEEERILFETRLIGFVTPPPSAIIEQFDIIAGNESVSAATTWLYNFCKACNYIRMPDISKNIKWEYQGNKGRIDITINLSKPEKDPKQIALAKLQPKSGYPSCMLCPSNVGFAGNLNHPARQTLRTIPIRLNNEPWQLQFSPYQYYEEHIIALSDEHRPMAVNSESLGRLLDFVDMFPHYFIGSNAALPIVGGSILTHDHYQGGKKVLPMMLAKSRKLYRSSTYDDTTISIVDWYNSVVRIEGNNRNSVLALATEVLETWFNYSDKSADILSQTTEQHNAITPIARNENGTYTFDLILRNNRTDSKHPDGIFHPDESLHNIKKEGIGIIEVMGLFILPGRLKSELETIKTYLTGEKVLNLKEINSASNAMYKHAQMIIQLVNDFGTENTVEQADKIVTDYVNDACDKILNCTAVFKNTDKGQNAFDKFMTKGLKLQQII